MWYLQDAVTALVFDTTSSNSGWKSGAAKLLEHFVSKNLFYLVCRHNIYELVMKATYQCVFGKETTGPQNSNFYHFKKKWSSVDKIQRFQTPSFERNWKLLRAKL